MKLLSRYRLLIYKMFQKMFYNTVLLNLLIVVVNAYSFTEITDTCSLPIKVGDCEAAIPRYGYNVTSKQCEQFSYGGCHGNPNNFANITACQTTCMDVCSLPQVVGSCKAYMPRYFFNKASGKCEEFIYGGCCGNANNFETLKDCQLVCKSHGTDMCCLPKDVGPCRAAVTRYFYNSRKRKCEKFTYGGCKGNANNFKCLDTCQKACQ